MSPLVIVGGTYVEKCDVPHWAELFGSGTRAAAALSGREVPIVLRTFIGKPEVSLLETCAASFGFTAEMEVTNCSIAFHYLHSLSPPSVHGVKRGEMLQLSITSENILRFGMIEGTAVVDGGNVVYDPQSPHAPQLFHANGSKAERLAIVLNRGEAAHLTGTSEVNEAGIMLMALEKAAAVIIKDGPRGATVFTPETTVTIPAYRTLSNWLLGSGDVFSAVFTYSWMFERKTAAESANEASLATAFYCQSKTLPIPVPLPDESSFHLGPIFHTNSHRRMVYLAGPSESLMQLWCIGEVRRCLLEQGFDVFSPYHLFGSNRRSKAIQRSLDTIERCDLVFAVLDGYDPNTVFEVGYAHALGKPVIGFSASKPSELNNQILFKAGMFQILEDLPSAIYASAWS